MNTMESALAGIEQAQTQAEIDLPIAVNNDHMQSLVNAYTPERGYAPSTSNSMAAMCSVFESNKRLVKALRLAISGMDAIALEKSYASKNAARAFTLSQIAAILANDREGE